MSTRIKLPNTDTLRSVVPNYIWRCRPFKFRPPSFAVESDRLKTRLVDEDVQYKSLENWEANPSTPLLYGVAGAPDDEQALYFAAWLVYLHMKKRPGAVVVWETLTSGFKPTKAETSLEYPSLLVVTNLTIDSTSHRIEKARDLLTQYQDIPRIVVCAGQDPISFFSTRLYLPIHSLAYFLEDSVRTKVSVI